MYYLYFQALSFDAHAKFISFEKQSLKKLDNPDHIQFNVSDVIGLESNSNWFRFGLKNYDPNFI